MRDEREGVKRRNNISPQQQPRGPNKAKHEPTLIDLHGAGGEGAGKKQLLRRQQLLQPPHLQGEQQSVDCCACNENNCRRRHLRCHRRRRRRHRRRCHLHCHRRCHLHCHRRRHRCYRRSCKPAARPTPESMARLFRTRREEKKREGIAWPPGAGREVEEIANAMQHAYVY